MNESKTSVQKPNETFNLKIGSKNPINVSVKAFSLRPLRSLGRVKSLRPKKRNIESVLSQTKENKKTQES